MPAKTRSKKATTATKSATQKKTVSASAKPTEVSKTAKKVEPAQKDTTTKTAAKKTTAKKVTPAKKTTAKKTAATKKVEKPAETKTTAAKVETKPAATKTTAAKAEAKPAVTTTAKAETKTTTAKVEAKPAAKTTAKKSTTKKTVAKKATTAKKSPAKRATAAKAANKKVAAKKATTKKTAKKPAINTEKIEQYKSFAMDTCFEMARAMGVNMDYDNYASLLLDNADIDALTKKVLDDFHVDTKAFTFEKDGYDADLIHVIFERVADTVDIKASDFEQIGKDVKAHAAYTIKDDATANNEEYQKEFDIVRKVLMIAQRKDIHQSADLVDLIKADVTDMIETFMDLAYHVLPLFEYDDVKYYENFIFAVLSQLDDLHQKWGNRALMDIADLYIKHGDYGQGDADYNYVLRENQIKDMIYYRFANVYVDIDLDKAKAIANSAFQYVDDRYDYYPKIIEILEK
ncbi:MAG: neurofilament protein [Absicoccus porci]|uniref:neurofilament protein n=1 Tax=Absicoccus porci TaxID=2486576 RepID=UPI002356E3F5|nr:neurofilament protein [Absicoccus porci]MCI6088476.1 neurofilament protein [Absicoccus porci]MDD7331071.1 neurofilament protein [Absicoccus porci]MDY4738800.1 neurofilament protein [Absicoccus porci]